MIKIDIKNKINLTMLAKAYMNKLLPRATSGEIFYSNDKMNEIKYIYFKNKDYYTNLISFINENQSSFFNSNAAIEWKNLFNALFIHTIAENIDFADLEHYSLSVDNNDNEREIDVTILERESKGDTFYRDMKRLYKGYEVTYWGSDHFVVIKLPFNPETEFKFDLEPMTRLLEMHKLTLDAFNFYRDPIRHLTVIRIGVK